jgi:hypothetical protein
VSAQEGEKVNAEDGKATLAPTKKWVNPWTITDWEPGVVSYVIYGVSAVNLLFALYHIYGMKKDIPLEVRTYTYTHIQGRV